MLPEIASLELTTETTTESNVIHKTFDWNFETGDFVVKDGRLVEVEGLDYIKVWVRKILNTELGTLIYEEYGSEHMTLIGKVYDKEFVRAELERTIKETLLKNEAIESVYDFKFETDGELLNLSLKVSTIYGNTEVITYG